MGREQARRRHHHSQHHRHGSARRKSQGHGPTLFSCRRQESSPRTSNTFVRSTAACAASATAPAGTGCPSPMFSAASPTPRATASLRSGRERYLELACRALGPLRRLRLLHGQLPARRSCRPPHGPRPGALCMKVRCVAAGRPAFRRRSAAQSLLDCHFVSGWEQSGAIRQYASDNLYDYKDGGAEGYLVFGFIRMTGIDCKIRRQHTHHRCLRDDRSPMRPTASSPPTSIPPSPFRRSAWAARCKRRAPASPRANSTSRSSKSPPTPRATTPPRCAPSPLPLEVRLQGRATPPAQLLWFPPGNVAPVRMVPESVLGLRELKRGYVAKYKARPGLHRP